MSKMKLLKPLLLVAAGVVAGQACTLPKPKDNSGAGGSSEVCMDDVAGGAGSGGAAGAGGAAGEGGMSGAGGAGGMSGSGGTGGTSSYTETTDIARVIPAVACAGDEKVTRVIDKYSKGYEPSKALLDRVDMAINTMSLFEEAQQMRGTKYGDGASNQFNDIQRSQDTTSMRGFRYRDASRGMNLGEDMGGAKPVADKINGTWVGYSTAFPVSMARGAAFDLDLEYEVGEAIGDEMQAAKETLLLAPCMNVLRHPLWGRSQETYGEDPYLVGRLASAMTVGVQEHIAANAKHFMAYDIEFKRDANNAELDEQSLRETYGRHFRMVVQDGGVASVMAAYNLVNGVKSTQNKHILTEVLRDDFKFRGFVLSDWWAMPITRPGSADTTTLKRFAVEAVKAGMDVELPWGLQYGQLENIVNTPNGGLTKQDLDVSVRRILEQKFRFNADPLTGNVGIGTPRTRYGNHRIACDLAHIMLSQKAAEKSMVLLKNQNDTLPIKAATAPRKIAVVGATVPYDTTDGSNNTSSSINYAVDAITGDLGSSRVYHDPAKGIGPFAGVCKAVGGTVGGKVKDPTCTTPDASLTTVTRATTDLQTGDTSAAVAAAADADFVVVVAGMTPEDEGEEYTTNFGDRTSLSLDAKQAAPIKGVQDKLIAEVAALGKPMVVVLEGGSVVDMPWLPNVPAVVMAWYPGQMGGAALGRLLFGQANFSGKLPLTWGAKLTDYPTFNANLTSAGTANENPTPTSFDYFVGYSWFETKGITPVYPFGHGLSYTKFEYRNLQLGCSEMSKGAVMPVVVNVANTGTVAGDEIVMVFISHPETTTRRWPKELKGFMRVHLEPGQEKQVTIPVRLEDLDVFKQTSPDPKVTTGKWVVETGNVKVMVGGASNSLPLSKTVKVNGFER